MSIISNKFALKKTACGLGLFSCIAFKKGDFVIEYTGTLSRNADIAQGGRYLFEVDKEWTVDGSGRENLSRYINHACQPNCQVVISGKSILIYAKRDIGIGEELSYDYGRDYFDFYIKPKGCRCPACFNGL